MMAAPINLDKTAQPDLAQLTGKKKKLGDFSDENSAASKVFNLAATAAAADYEADEREVQQVKKRKISQSNVTEIKPPVVASEAEALPHFEELESLGRLSGLFHSFAITPVQRSASEPLPQIIRPTPIRAASATASLSSPQRNASQSQAAAVLTAFNEE